jgi:hypothetical protein
MESSVACTGDGCGRAIRLIMTATVVVNKRSLRTVGIILGGFEHTRCPDCGTEVPRSGVVPREPYRLMPDDAAKVAAYRRRRWGVEDTGENVERVAG